MTDSKSAQFVDISEVAEVLRVSPDTVFRMIRDGSLPAIRTGSAYRIPQKVVYQIALSGLGQWSQERDPVAGSNLG